ncbi:MAG: carbohydrate ABC transporter permease, partial [Chloroflexota bacterium]
MTATARASGAEPVVGERASARKLVAYALLIGWALLMFVPFAWTILTSIKTRPEAMQLALPASPTLDGYLYVWDRIDPGLPQMIFSSLLLAVIVTASNLFLGSMAGYAFARLSFPGRDALFVVVLATLMIPDQLRIVPVYQIMRFLGLINKDPSNYLSVILVLAVSATSIFLLRQYFLTIPRDLEEAARIDGAGYFQTYWQVILPLASPALAAVGILQFQGTWNGLFWPLVFMNQAREHWTLPIGITQFQTSFETNWPPLMA